MAIIDEKTETIDEVKKYSMINEIDEVFLKLDIL